MGSSSRRLDQPVGSRSGPLDQSVGSEATDQGACLRKLVDLLRFCPLTWHKDKVLRLLRPSFGAETSFIGGCATRPLDCSGFRSKECWAIRIYGLKRRTASPASRSTSFFPTRLWSFPTFTG